MTFEFGYIYIGYILTFSLRNLLRKSVQSNDLCNCQFHLCTCLQVFWTAPRGGSCCPMFEEGFLLAACFIVPWSFAARCYALCQIPVSLFNDLLPPEVSTLVASYEVHPKQWHMWPSDPDAPSPCSGLFVYHSLCPSLQFVITFLFAAMSREVG